jgi:hypothetical protein
LESSLAARGEEKQQSKHAENSENSVAPNIGNQAKKTIEDSVLSPAGDEEQSQCAFEPSMKIRNEYSRKAEKIMSSIKKKKEDGRRGLGLNPERGWWISLQEAKVLAMNEEWWTETEKIPVGAKPVAIPKNEKKPIWLFESGKMHLGPWKLIRFGNGGVFRWCKSGYGITFEAKPPHRKGNCYVGQFLNGRAHGRGRSFWSKNSPSWKFNYLAGSQIKSPIKRGLRQEGGLPYEYEGNFEYNRKHDPNGVATLKDGTRKKGGWAEDVIVGRDWFRSSDTNHALVSQHGLDWWTHHDDYDEPLDISSPATRAIENRRKKGKRKKPPLEFSIHRPTKHQKEETASRIVAIAAAPEKTVPLVAAHSKRLPVDVTPDSSDVIDLCDSDGSVGGNDVQQSYSPTPTPRPEAVYSIFTNHRKNNIGRRTNGTSDSETRHRATPIPHNIVSKVVGNPQNGTRNHSNASTSSHASYPSIQTAQSRATTLPQSNNLVARVESNNTVGSFNASNVVPSHRRRREINKIALVLRTEVIVYEENQEEMEAYARELDSVGFSSVKIILEFCHADDVEKWPWMKPIHKRAFRRWLKSKQKEWLESKRSAAGGDIIV